MNKKDNFPQFVSNAPCGKDLFEGKSQEKIASAIEHDITTGEKKIIGIDGGWGAGKSNVVKIVESKLPGDNYVFFVYDVWGHQQDLQRRSILEELVAFLIEKNFLKDKDEWECRLKKLTGKTVETKIQSIPKVSFGILCSFIVIILLPALAPLADFLNESFGLNKIWTLVLPFLFFIIIYVCYLIHALCNDAKGRCLGIALSNMIAIYRDKEIENSQTEFTHERNPSVIDFSKFIDMISKAITDKKHIVLVFDNMDRLPIEKVKELWASLHILFANRDICPHDNVHVIVPFDRNHIKSTFRNDGSEESYGDDYINKTFDIVYRVAPPILSDWKKFFFIKWQEANLKCSEEEYNHVVQIYDLLRVDSTPRSIIVFVNEFVAIKRQLEENIPDRYIAIFILKKNEILYDSQKNKNSDKTPFVSRLKNPQRSILDKSFLGPLKNIYQNDDDLSKYIAALVYQIPSSRAIQIIYANQMRLALENANKEDLKFIQDNESSFNALLDSVLVDLMNPENAAIALGYIDQEKFGTKYQSIWDELYSLCRIRSLSIDNEKLLESHSLLIRNISEKESFIKLILRNIVEQEDSKFNIIGYYDVLCEISDILNNFGIKITPLLPDKKVSAEVFLKLLAHAQEGCSGIKISTDLTSLDDFLQKKESKELQSIEAICYAEAEVRHAMIKFCQKLQTLSRQCANDQGRLPIIIKLLTSVSPKLVDHGLNDNQVTTQFAARKKTDIGYYDFLCMRIARVDKFENRYISQFEEALRNVDSTHIQSIVCLINKHISFGDMLVHLPVMKKYPTYIAVLKDIITNWRGTHSATIEKILPDITKYANILEVDENILWDRLSQLENPTLDLKDVPKFLPLDTLISAKKSRSALSKYCVERAQNYFSNLSDEDWKKCLSNHESYGIEQFIAITGKWSASLSECVKQILCGIADKSIPLPQNSKWSEFIDYIVATGHSVNAIFNSVIDTILTGSGIDDKQFIFWGEWLLQYGILTGRQDVLRKIFPIGILKRPEAVNIILKYKEKMPAILDAAGDDSIEFKNAIIEIIVADEKSPLCSLADFLSIKVEASVKDSQGEKTVK